jgi:L-arabonate dehydrase
VLHASPEAAAGGPLAIVRDGDMIALDVEQRTLTLDVPQEEIEKRLAAWQPQPLPAGGGYQQLYVQHVMQAHEGADFDFLRGGRGLVVPRESH